MSCASLLGAWEICDVCILPAARMCMFSELYAGCGTAVARWVDVWMCKKPS